MDKMCAEVSYSDFVAFDVHYVASLTLRRLVERGEKDGKGSRREATINILLGVRDTDFIMEGKIASFVRLPGIAHLSLS
jgi:hypothetical protein